jgi:hypothetical protein
MRTLILIAALAAGSPAFAETAPSYGSDKAYVFKEPAVRLPLLPRPTPPLALAPLPDNARPFVPPQKPAYEPKKNSLQLAQAEPAPRPLPPESFHWDSNRKDLKSFESPSSVIIGNGPRELPRGTIQQDRLMPKSLGEPAKPEPQPEKKPEKSIG